MNSSRQNTIAIIALVLIIGISSVALILAADRDSGSLAGRGVTNGIAVLYIDGQIVSGRGDAGIFGVTIGADDVVQSLRDAAADPGISAIVLRLNSPGGSAAGSQEIAAAIHEIRQDDMVVVASMADVAASGAYWIAAACDEIVADPATITGSIGVILQVQNVAELFDTIGISVETFKSGEYKDLGSPTRDVTEHERMIIDSLITDIYDQFVAGVAEGRKMSYEDVKELADGRIFTGRQAHELGLVDTLGGLHVSYERAADRAGLDSYRIIEIGRGTWFFRLMSTTSSDAQWGQWAVFRHILSIPWSGFSG